MDVHVDVHVDLPVDFIRWFPPFWVTYDFEFEPKIIQCVLGVGPVTWSHRRLVTTNLEYERGIFARTHK